MKITLLENTRKASIKANLHLVDVIKKSISKAIQQMGNDSFVDAICSRETIKHKKAA